MLKRLLCEATIHWSLDCPGPFLIKDGRYEKKAVVGGDDKKNPNEVFISRSPIAVVNQRVGQAKGKGSMLVDLPYYVPGTSLRGAVRSRAEQILRTVITHKDSPRTACVPFEEGDVDLKSCSRRMVDKKPEPSPYADACPACKLFGCTATASRIDIPDSDIKKGFKSSFRDLVGIDRFTGGAFQGQGNGEGGGAKMRLHVLEGASFEVEIRLRNFEHWQLGLLAHVFRDFQNGDVGLGFGSSAKAYGRVKGKVTGVSFKYRTNDDTSRLPDVGTLSNGDGGRYRFAGKCLKGVGLEKEERDPLGFYQSYKVQNFDGLWERSAALFHEFVKGRNKACGSEEKRP